MRPNKPISRDWQSSYYAEAREAKSSENQKFSKTAAFQKFFPAGSEPEFRIGKRPMIGGLCAVPVRSITAACRDLCCRRKKGSKSMHNQLRCLAAIALLIGTVTPCAAGMIFSDDFEGESVGDNIQQLTNWKVTAGQTQGTIISDGANQLLRLDPSSTGGRFVTIETRDVFGPFGPGTTLSLSLDMAVLDPVPQFTMEFGFGSSVNPESYRVRVIPNLMNPNSGLPDGTQLFQLVKSSPTNNFEFLRNTINNNVNTLFTFDTGVSRHFELQAAFGVSETNFSVFVDGDLLFTAVDTDPVDLSGGFPFFLRGEGPATGEGGSGTFDNVSASVVPEPSSLLLLSLGAAGILFAVSRSKRRSKAYS